MAKKKEDTKSLILKTIIDKVNVKEKVFNNTYGTFRLLRKVLSEITEEYNKDLPEEKYQLEYRHRGKYECELKVGSDLIIFSMQGHVFEFDRTHMVWKTSYVQNNVSTSYAGIINIYNFLADSFKFNRTEDLGYLIGRIFINKDKHFFVEGKRQLGFLYNDFVNAVVDKEAVRNIVNSAILYSLDFDMLVPPYDNVKITSVSQIQERISTSQSPVGKRLGFKFYVQDKNIDNDRTK